MVTQLTGHAVPGWCSKAWYTENVSPTALAPVAGSLNVRTWPKIAVLTTAPHGAYDFRSGTSLAAAHVSGIAALLIEREPRLTPGQVRELLLTTPHPTTAKAHPSVASVGRVDACAGKARRRPRPVRDGLVTRSEEHTSELQSL